MYEQFFGLQERPFDLVPDPRYLYLTARQREAVSSLRLGLLTSRGLTLLVGEAGTGKTTILKAVLSDLDQASIEWVLLSNPALTRSEFFESLAEGFGLGVEAARSKATFVGALREHLEGRHAAGLLTALVLDEAQSMSFELLEEVRLLGNIETTTAKLLNVVLAGQPNLAARLNAPDLRQLKQRISLRCELAPLQPGETAAYIAGRIRIAGGEPASIFSREAILAIHEAAEGIPRTINVICDNALIGAYAAQMRPILRTMIEDICRDFDLGGDPAMEPASPAVAEDSGQPPEDGSAPADSGVVGDAAAPAPDGARKRFSFF